MVNLPWALMVPAACLQTHGGSISPSPPAELLRGGALPLFLGQLGVNSAGVEVLDLEYGNPRPRRPCGRGPDRLAQRPPPPATTFQSRIHR